jgi:prepilin-type N-terminal cleavage/methylation domain-containing protein
MASTELERSAPQRTGSPRAAFTLIELMIAVCIVGVLASIALPGYAKLIMTARGGEGPEQLGLMYRGAAAYWENSTTARKGIANRGGAGRCVATGAAWSMIPAFPPGATKRTGDFSTDSVFQAIGFTPSGPLYFTYTRFTNSFPGLECNWPEHAIDPAQGWPYVFHALCDFDEDGSVGGFSLETGVRDGQIYRQMGFGSIGDQLPGCAFCVSGID